MWQVTIVVTLVPVTWEVVRGMAHGDFGVDIIALLATLAALIGDGCWPARSSPSCSPAAMPWRTAPPAAPDAI